MSTQNESTYATHLRSVRDGADAQREAALPAFVHHARAAGADFTLNVFTAGQLGAVLRTIGGHNRYDADAAATLLGPLVVDAMHVQVREFVGGPSIHFGVPFYSGQLMSARRLCGSSGVQITPQERRAYVERVMEAARELRADEISVSQVAAVGVERETVWGGRTGENPYEIRLWWD